MKWLPLLLVLAGLARASSPYVSLDHWSYPLLEELHQSGALPELAISNRPWTRQEISRALAAQNESYLPAWSAKTVRMLREVFPVDSTPRLDFLAEAGEEYAVAESIGTNWSAKAGLFLSARHISAVARAKSEEWYANAPHSLYPWKQDRAASVRMSDLYLKTDWAGFTAGLGRLNWIWGPFGRQSLILGDQAFSFDQLFFLFHWRRLRLAQIIAELDRHGESHRYLTLHRLDVDLGRGLALGLFESILYQGTGRDYSLKYLNPVGLYFLEQMNNQLLYQEDGNSLIGFDAEWVHPKVNLRMQVMIDDFQVDNEDGGDLEPPAMGGMAGADLFWPSPVFGPDRYLTLEFTKLTNRVYNAMLPAERYTYYTTGLAYPNSDLENYFASYTVRTVKPFMTWKPFVEFRRQGEGGINEFWGEVTDGGNLGFRDEKTPTGIVDQTLTLGLEGSYRPRSFLGAGFTVGYYTEDNVGNVSGVSEQGPVFKLKIDATWGRKLF